MQQTLEHIGKKYMKSDNETEENCPKGKNKKEIILGKERLRRLQSQLEPIYLRVDIYTNSSEIMGRITHICPPAGSRWITGVIIHLIHQVIHTLVWGAATLRGRQDRATVGPSGHLFCTLSIFIIFCLPSSSVSLSHLIHAAPMLKCCSHIKCCSYEFHNFYSHMY